MPGRRLDHWVVAVCVSSSLAVLLSASIGGLPLRWAIVGLFGLVMVGPGKTTLVMPSNFGLSAGTLISCAAVAALPPHGRLVGAWIVGACDGLEWRRLRSGKAHLVAFNVAALGATGLASAAVYSSAGGHGIAAAAAAGVAHVTVNNALVMPGVLLQGAAPSVWATLDLPTLVVEPLLAFGGLLLGQLYPAHGPTVVAVLVGPVVVARLVLGYLARSRHAYQRLESVHGFTRELETAPADGDALRWMLLLLAGRIGATTAAAIVDEPDGARRCDTTADGDDDSAPSAGPPPPPHRSPWAALGAVLVGDLAPGTPERQALTDEGLGAGMVAPLQVDGRRLGTLAVGGTANQRAYTDDDLRLLETFASSAAAWLERRRLLERLRHDSTHDQLTALPNRRHFLERTDAASRPAALLVAGLDRFKEVNDTLGHDQGDALLCAVGSRLGSTFPGAVVARLGADEFGVLLEGTSNGDASAAALHLLTSLEQPFALGQLRLEITAAVGLTVARDDTPAITLLQQADIAMARAKSAHSGWELFSPERDHHSPWRLSLAADLRRGIDLGQLEVHYQPKAALADGRVQGLEALVRWRHPRYGLLSPDQFVPVAEQAGLIRPLTLAVLHAACSEQVALRRQGFDLGVAVNLSVRSLLDVNFPDQVAEVLGSHGVSAERLTLEITEGSLMTDPARSIGILGRLADAGTAISIDDFGSGYSSLGYLKRLPATEVKIDRSFVFGMRSDRSDAAIVRSTIDLAHNLGLRAVAEGVEDPGTWADLATAGCDEAQGYFLSAPLPADALRAWLLRTATSERDGGL
ncbi:MAG TPA: GGDEF domain-containing protein [Acidimicrobiales bacterium]|nr:GGDEF domain-containing protein [Acidimicrobiales bacterium]